MDFLAIYSEAGMIGIVGIMFVYLVISLSKKSEAQQEMLKNLEIEKVMNWYEEISLNPLTGFRKKKK